MTIAYALGGGGARGIAHIGVLKALDEAGIKPDLVAGTSMGSVIGAAYAQTQNAAEVEKRMQDFISSKDYDALDLGYYHRTSSGNRFFGHFAKRLEERIVINLSVSQKSVIKNDILKKALDALLEPGSIENLPLKYAAVAGDLVSGEKVVLTSGDIKTAVLASSSIPGFLPPVEYAGRQLADGEIADLVPCQTARELGASFVITVDVSQDLAPSPPLENALDIMFRAGQIKSHDLRVLRMKASDFTIHPAVGTFHWTNFEAYQELIEAGYKAGIENMPRLKKKLRMKRWQFWK